MPKAKAIGQRGSWFAKVNGERLPCVHAHWVKGTHLCDPGYVASEPQWAELLEAIQETGKIVLTKDDPYPASQYKTGIAFNRTGYIAVYTVSNVVADDVGLRFDLTGRVCDLQG